VSDTLAFDAAPIVLDHVTVGSEWLNASGHMRASHYVVLFDEAIQPFLARIGLSNAQAGGAAPFLLEMHTCYQRELRLGDEVHISVQALGMGEKSVHLIMFMRDGRDDVVATTELAIVNVALDSRRAQSWTRQQQDALTALTSAHASLPVPPQAGRAIAFAKR
jgi:acyl-CoA thioester hydrolase